MSTRIIRSESVSWWPGNIESESGVHLHHLVFGIVTMMVAGTLRLRRLRPHAAAPRSAPLAFGIGVGLTIDEFALWVHLEDVYWAEEGRSSIDATVIAAAVMLLIAARRQPAGDRRPARPRRVIASILAPLLVFAWSRSASLKGRILHGVVGFFVLPIAIYGACRIGKPRSAWARRRYGERRPKKQAKAEARFQPDRRTERFKEAFRDIVGGKPSEGLAAVGEEAVGAAREAGDEVREQAERLSHVGDGDREGREDRD